MAFGVFHSVGLRSHCRSPTFPLPLLQAPLNFGNSGRAQHGSTPALALRGCGRARSPRAAALTRRSPGRWGGVCVERAEDAPRVGGLATRVSAPARTSVSSRPATSERRRTGEEGVRRWGAAIGGSGGAGGGRRSQRAGAQSGQRSSPEKGLVPRQSWREIRRRRPLRPRAAAGSARRAWKVTLFIYLLAFSLLGWIRETPLWTLEARVRPLRPPFCRRGQLPGIHAHASPAPPPRTQTRAGGGPSPGLWRVLQGGSRGGQRGRGWGEPQRSRLSFQSALSVPGWVGPEPLKADPPPALAPAARPELSRPRPWRQTDREFPTASDGAELRAVGAARRFGDRCMLSSLGETQERLGILGGGDQLRAGTMFLVTLYFALPLLGKSRLPLAFLSAESSRGVLAAAHPKLRRGCGGCGRAKFRFGEGDHESSAPRPREAVAARSGPQRFVLGLDFLWFLMTSPGGEWMGSEHSSPGLSAPCESRGARGDAPSRWGVGAYWTRIQTSKGKLFPE